MFFWLKITKMIALRIIRLLFVVVYVASAIEAAVLSEPFEGIDAATQKLANSFEKLVHDASSAASLSDFTSELSTSAIQLLENVPPAMVVDTVEKQTKVASDNNGLPNPDEESCSRDYTGMCPDNWIDSGDGIHCKAPEIYSGPCEKQRDMNGQTPRDKKLFAAQCGVVWPCRSFCVQDYSYSCPETWIDLGDGSCQAPDTYTGRCVQKKSFAEFNSNMKRKWSLECTVKWPCVKRNFDFTSGLCPIYWTEQSDGNCTAPASYLGPCSLNLPIGAMNDDQKVQLSRLCKISWPGDTKAGVDMSEPCPAGWTQMSQNYSDCEAPPHYEGPCPKIQSFEDFTDDKKIEWGEKCDVSWPFKEKVERDYEADCPGMWQLSEDMCVAPSTYEGRCETRFTFKNYTQAMKAAWAHACSATWPTSALSKLKIVKPFQLQKQFVRVNSADEGPISSETGAILSPKTNNTTSNMSPVTPDDKASASLATEQHIDVLRRLQRHFTNPKLFSALDDAIEQLERQGGNGELQFATSFLQHSESVISGIIQPAYVASLQPLEDMVEAAEDSMTGDVVRNPETPCTQDFNNCPEGWQNLDYDHCMAPESYTANGGPCNPVFALGDMVTEDSEGNLVPDMDLRKAWQTRCGVRFPCVKCNHNYVTVLCPSGWKNIGSGYCKAPADYSEQLRFRCGDMVNFAFASSESRKSWAQICGADWPCFSNCEPDFSYPCPIGFEESREGCKAVSFRSESEEAICQSPLEVPDDVVTKRDIALQCNTSHSINGISKCTISHKLMNCVGGVAWPCLNQCEQDFSLQYCPYGWTYEGRGECKAPLGYKPPLGCSTTMMVNGLSKNDLSMLAQQCHAPWPCKGECESDWTSPCPYKWKQQTTELQTFCLPSDHYKGPCTNKSNLTGFTFSQKQDFAFRCEVNWPCGGDSFFGLYHNKKWQKAHKDKNWIKKLLD